MKTIAAVALGAALLGTGWAPSASAQDTIRIFVGPIPSIHGIAPIETDGASASHRDIRRALNERKSLSAMARVVDTPDEADIAISIDARAYSMWSGKKLVATGVILRAPENMTVLDGTKGFVKHYRVQAGRIAEQTETWLRANADAILALRSK